MSSSEPNFRTNAAGQSQKCGLYDPSYEHDACGVGIVARIDGTPDHGVVTDGIKVLVNLEHRGATGGDDCTGDGAGLLTRIPDSFFRKTFDREGVALPPRGDYALGQIFLPRDEKLAEKLMVSLTGIVESKGCGVAAVRKVPLKPEAIGESARRSMPLIRQILVTRGEVPREDFERKLYVIRRLSEKAFGDWKNDDTSQYYICSLSSKTIVYKGLLTGSQLSDFYPDLKNEDFSSPFALIHQRYSTNTLPTWALAQPFRYLAHNGEINTLKGNVNQMRAREANFESKRFGAEIEDIKPVLLEGASDSAILDNAVELLTSAGRSLPHAMMMLVPEAFGPNFNMSADKRSFYEYNSAIMEPWDGPAALMFSDDRYVGATLDRNGLRPARYVITKDGLVVMSSETGVLELPPERIRAKGQLLPGKMFLVDLEEGRVVPDHEIKSKISRAHPYRHWLSKNKQEIKGMHQPAVPRPMDAERLHRLHLAFGYSSEDLKTILTPMAAHGQEAIGSMGNDTSMAVLSELPQLLFNYFKQLFAQVTNPPIDPLREELVMSLTGWLGLERNLLDETPMHCRRFRLTRPILTSADLELLRHPPLAEMKSRQIDMLFDPAGGGQGLKEGLDTLFEKAEEAIDQGANILIISDRRLSAKAAPIPVLLALSGLHHHLIRKKLRSRVGLVVDTAEAREVTHFAMLISFGANAVCPYLAIRTVHHLFLDGKVPGVEFPEYAVEHYINAIRKGLLKTMSRMGISTIRSYFAAQIFEAIGLSENLIEEYFTGCASRIGGIGMEELARETLKRFRQAYPEDGSVQNLLDVGGVYQSRYGGEKHLFDAEAIYKLQHAVRSDDYAVFREYTRLIDDQSEGLATLRGLFKFKEGQAIDIDEVEPEEAILKRFVTAAMSLGSISKEAHETIAIAMNRLGGRSNSGEGGEDAVRYRPLPNGDSKRSAIKQIASGRFGVTTEYLLNADELQIKMAQGAKPGEGGQLPGHKVTEEIARVRHTTPGVTLISPPPHHDIYSIEDLAQLIHDLKTVNRSARISVKLVSEVGVGTIAAGVAKAKADLVLISGHDGGTGASPLTSINYAGTPWELGLAETQQTLVGNNLRDRIRVQVDGQLKTGRDLAIAALLGAEEFGFGTTILVSLGCTMMRKCHLNTCPVGVATQDPELRSRFTGKPEYVERFLRFIVRQLREIMAGLGFRSLDDMIGRSDILDTEDAIRHWKTLGLDFTPILSPPHEVTKGKLICPQMGAEGFQAEFEQLLIDKASLALEDMKKVTIDLPVKNIHRTVGARLSAEIVRCHGPKGLPEDTITINLSGSAGQSLGAFLAPGIRLKVMGDANDGVAKGMSGGRIVIVKPPGATYLSHENTIIGNTALYGATGGEVFIAGKVGMRFAVRNSGAVAVVEGASDHCCEYMTGGRVVVLGRTGDNFAAGMSGGIAYVFDETELFDTRCNLDMVDLETVWRKEDRQELMDLIKRHLEYTGSLRAAMILENWDNMLPRFVKVIPIEYRSALARMHLEEKLETDAIPVSEEVYDG